MFHPPHFYFPNSPLFLLVLFVGLAFLIALIELRVLTYAYAKMGVDPRYVFAILLLSLFGSGINIPIASFPAKDIVTNRKVESYGVTYVVPEIKHENRTILAVNVGGCLIPVALSIYLLVKNPIIIRAAIGVVILTVGTHLMAKPVPGLGISLPIFLPPILAALTAVLLDRERAAPIAYVAGSLGTLLGADVLNLYRLQELGAPIASIGGAGISDGIFLTGTYRGFAGVIEMKSTCADVLFLRSFLGIVMFACWVFCLTLSGVFRDEAIFFCVVRIRVVVAGGSANSCG